MPLSKFALLMGFASCLLVGSAFSQGTYSCERYQQLVQENKNNCLWYWGWDSLPDPNAPSTMVCCNPGGIPFGESCVAPMPSCRVPLDSANKTCLSCNKQINIPPQEVGSPINLSTGNTYIAQSDISMPGLGGGLSLFRIWNSILPAEQNTYPFMFGPAWRSNYEERLIFVSGDGFLKYLRSDGSVWLFGVAALGNPVVYKVAAPSIDTTTTITNGSPSWTVAFKNGEKRKFDATTGALVAIIDRNGNSTSLTYDSSNRLATVSDPGGRHLAFTYLSPSSNLVTGVSSDVGISLSYSYDAQGRLIKVTKPDSTTVSFDYDAQSMITAVRDSDGKVLESHTYDTSGRGLTSSRANGVDSVTVTYP